MPDPGGKQDPADHDRNTDPGGERQCDRQKPADQHENPPIIFPLPVPDMEAEPFITFLLFSSIAHRRSIDQLLFANT